MPSLSTFYLGSVDFANCHKGSVAHLCCMQLTISNQRDNRGYHDNQYPVIRSLKVSVWNMHGIHIKYPLGPVVLCVVVIRLAKGLGQNIGWWLSATQYNIARTVRIWGREGISTRGYASPHTPTHPTPPPLFQPKSLILRSNKTGLFKAKRDFIFIIQEFYFHHTR